MFLQYHPLIPKHLPNPLQSTCHVVSFGCCRVNSPPARRGHPCCGCRVVPWPAGCSAPGSCDTINCEPQRRHGAATAGYGGLWPADRAKDQCRILCVFFTFFFNIKDQPHISVIMIDFHKNDNWYIFTFLKITLLSCTDWSLILSLV